MYSTDERKERSRQLCRILTRYIHEKTSPGLGHWEPTWEIVEQESNTFLDMLADYEYTAHEDYFDWAKEAAWALLGRWQDAEAFYQREQRMNRKARLHAGQHTT